MSPGNDYAPCPHCAANNISHRRVCWRCGFTLPYTVGIDGQRRANLESPRPVSQAEIARMLDQAQTFDLETSMKRAEAQEEMSEKARITETPLKIRAWFWLRRRKERQSGA
jgi:hypothetical protein